MSNDKSNLVSGDRIFETERAKGERRWESRFNIGPDPYTRAVADELDLTVDGLEQDRFIMAAGRPVAAPLWYDDLPVDDEDFYWDPLAETSEDDEDLSDEEMPEDPQDLEDWLELLIDALVDEEPEPIETVRVECTSCALETEMPLAFLCPDRRFYPVRKRAREGKVVKRMTRAEKHRQGWLRRKRIQRRALRCGGSLAIAEALLDESLSEMDEIFQTAIDLVGAEE